MEAKNGLVVKSIAGHDKGLYFVIKKVEGDFVLLANGKLRKLDKPKRKSLKHIRLTHTVIELDEITDKQLRRALSEYNSKPTVTESAGE